MVREIIVNNSCQLNNYRHHSFNQPRLTGRVGQKYLITVYVLCGLVGAVLVAAVAIYVARRRSHFQEKVSQWVVGARDQEKMSSEYQVNIGQPPISLPTISASQFENDSVNA